MKRTPSLPPLVVLLSAIFLHAGNSIEPVGNFDLQKSLGKWYEVARLPVGFEKNLIHVTSTYSLRKNGTIRIDNNATHEKTSRKKRLVTKARFAGRKDVGHLKASIFGPFSADFKIIDVDRDYRYMMIAGSKECLWILSRTPVADGKRLRRMIDKAECLGFPTDKLYFTPQKSEFAEAEKSRPKEETGGEG